MKRIFIEHNPAHYHFARTCPGFTVDRRHWIDKHYKAVLLGCVMIGLAVGFGWHWVLVYFI